MVQDSEGCDLEVQQLLVRGTGMVPHGQICDAGSGPRADGILSQQIDVTPPAIP